MQYLSEVLESVFAQTFGNFSVVVVDNGSNDGTVEFIRENYPAVTVIQNNKNLGFAKAHNQGIEYARAYFESETEELYVLVTNPDVILEPDYTERIVASIEARPDVGSAGGKLMKVFQEGQGLMRESVKSRTIDSVGIRIMKSRCTVDRGSGEGEESAEYRNKKEVFGVSGALALYRMKALRDVAYRGEYFDEDFFAYKEDIDLAWRMRLRGWSSLYVPAARAYHYRAAAAKEKATLAEIWRNRKRKSGFVNYYSYKNHLLMLVKNEFVQNVLIDGFRIWSYEAIKLLYIMVFEPRTLRAAAGFLRQLPGALRKRRLIMARVAVRPGEIRKWFG